MVPVRVVADLVAVHLLTPHLPTTFRGSQILLIRRARSRQCHNSAILRVSSRPRGRVECSRCKCGRRDLGSLQPRACKGREPGIQLACNQSMLTLPLQMPIRQIMDPLEPRLAATRHLITLSRRATTLNRLTIMLSRRATTFNRLTITLRRRTITFNRLTITLSRRTTTFRRRATTLNRLPITLCRRTITRSPRPTTVRLRTTTHLRRMCLRKADTDHLLEAATANIYCWLRFCMSD